jgi:DNA-binding Xre family transcriptional regulator
MNQKGIKKFDLRKSGVHSVVIEKLKADKNVDVSTISKLCALLNCQPGDIMEYVPDDDQP